MKNWLWEQYGASEKVSGSGYGNDGTTSQMGTGSNSVVNAHLGSNFILSEQYGLMSGDAIVEITDICFDNCDEWELWTWTHVGNQGLVPLQNVHVEASYIDIEGNSFALEEREYGEIPPGTTLSSDLWQLNIPDCERVKEIKMTVSTQRECNENNNTDETAVFFQ